MRSTIAGAVVLAAACGGGGSGSAPPKPAITLFSAAPDHVDPGQTVVLSWTVASASEVRIDEEGLGVVLEPTSALAGTVTTMPLAKTTTFILTATLGGESSTKSISVTVKNPMSAAIQSFTANPNMIDPGQSVTLSWRTVGAVEGQIRPQSGGAAYVIAPDKVGQGNWTIEQLTHSETYTLAVKGADGLEATEEVSIVFNGPEILVFAAMPNPIMRGETSVLAWNVRDAVEVTISSDSSGLIHEGPDLTGTILVHPEHTEVFTLVAADALGLKTTAVDTVMVNAPANAAKIVSFDVQPSLLTLGSATTVSWVVENAQGVQIVADGVVVSATTALSGHVVLHPDRTTNYALLAKNTRFGDVTLGAAVHVDPGPPAILSFAADPPLGPLDASFDLAWQVLGADMVRILSPLGTTVATSTHGTGSIALTITSSMAPFTLLASNAVGEARARALVSASNDAPGISKLFVEPGRIAPLTTVNATVSFGCIAASSVTLAADGVVLSTYPRALTGAEMVLFAGYTQIALGKTTRFDLAVVDKDGVSVTRSVLASAAAGEVEPNDVVQAAQPLGTLLPGQTLDVEASIASPRDEDFFSFVLQRPVLVDIWTYEALGNPTSCPTDDTEMWLYDGIPTSLTATSHAQERTIVAYDDDQGPGFCAQIGGMSGRGGGIPLTPGTYYVRVRRYAQETVIPRYVLRIQLD